MGYPPLDSRGPYCVYSGHIVMPGILKHFIDRGERIVTSWLNSDMLLEFVQSKQSSIL